MLSPEIESLLRGQIDVALTKNAFRPHPPRFGQFVLEQSFGGEILQPSKVAKNSARVMNDVGHSIFESMQKVLTAVPVQQYSDLETDLLQIFNSEFDPCVEAIRQFLGDSLKKLSHSHNTAGSDDFCCRTSKPIRAALEMDIKLLVKTLMKPQPPSGSNVTVTLANSAIGVLQTGEGSSVKDTTITFTPEDNRKLKELLQQLSEGLETVESLPSNTRAELRDVIVEANSELDKPKPNWIKLRGLLASLWTGVKGVGTLVSLYNAAKVMLAPLGVMLP